MASVEWVGWLVLITHLWRTMAYPNTKSLFNQCCVHVHICVYVCLCVSEEGVKEGICFYVLIILCVCVCVSESVYLLAATTHRYELASKFRH